MKFDLVGFEQEPLETYDLNQREAPLLGSIAEPCQRASGTTSTDLIQLLMQGDLYRGLAECLRWHRLAPLFTTGSIESN